MADDAAPLLPARAPKAVDAEAGAARAEEIRAARPTLEQLREAMVDADVDLNADTDEASADA